MGGNVFLFVFSIFQYCISGIVIMKFAGKCLIILQNLTQFPDF